MGGSYLGGRVQAVREVEVEVQDSVHVGSFVRALCDEPATHTLFVGSSAGVFELPIHRKPSGDVRFGRRDGAVGRSRTARYSARSR